MLKFKETSSFSQLLLYSIEEILENNFRIEQVTVTR